MAPADAVLIATRSRFALGMAVASLVCIFAFSIPLLSDLGEGLFLAHDVPLPKAVDLMIRVPPRLPGSIAVFGSLGLLMKEARISPVAALRWNWAAVFADASSRNRAFECSNGAPTTWEISRQLMRIS